MKLAAVHLCGGEHREVGISTKPLAAQGFASHTGVLAAEGKADGVFVVDIDEKCVSLFV